MRRSSVGLLVGTALALGGCNHPAAVQATATPSTTASPTASPTAAPTVSPTPVPTHRATPSATVSRSRRPTPTPAPVRTTAAVRRTADVCPGLSGVAGTQVVLVVGSGSSARVRACEKRSGQWVSVMGSMYGHVGRNGVAPARAKREGDGRTPSGTFVLGRGFGQRSSPGVRFSWRVVDSHDVWVDDSASSLYNSWQRTPANGRWRSAEPMDQASYAYAQVIDYNTARTPGLGSAIFFHVDHASGTSGCVSLPTASLLKVMRWERAGARMVIRRG